MSLIGRLLCSLLGQPQRREPPDGLLFTTHAVITQFDGENRPLAVVAEEVTPATPDTLRHFIKGSLSIS
jgi:hypothetical protein